VSGAAKEGAPPADAGAPAHPVPLLEWVIAAMGALLVAAAIAYLVHQALWRDETPPEVRLAVERVLPLQGGYVVEFRATNRGAQAAQELVVEGKLAGPGGVAETAEATFDYLPPNSYREGGLFFTGDPRRGELHLRAKGYARP
jgi:uncharacterized protein (TIGR02588 family)